MKWQSPALDPNVSDEYLVSWYQKHGYTFVPGSVVELEKTVA